MDNTLIVPIKLDALVLERDRPLVQAVADFSRLPYSDGKQDYNTEIAYISEDIVSQPFSNRNLWLGAGLHLYWHLPRGLRKGRQTDAGPDFPPVPNRWLVTRKFKNKIQQQWVVESDYLYPAGQGADAGSVNIFYPPNTSKKEYSPFRYLGCKIPLGQWKEDRAAQRLEPFTVLGYGEPSFATFYPNCHNVFGCHDPLLKEPALRDLSYEVIGWYSDPQADALKDFWDQFGTDFKKANETAPALEDYQAALAEQFLWQVQQEEGSPLPEGLICYGRLGFRAAASAKKIPIFNEANVSITVGTSSHDALCTYLAQNIDRRNQSVLTEQLQAVTGSGSQEEERVSLTFHQHEEGFQAVSAGFFWRLEAQRTGEMTSDTSSLQHQQDPTLPVELTRKLEAINSLQRTYNQVLTEIDVDRQQLFADWYKYMLSAYPPGDNPDEYPDVDEVAHYLRVRDMEPLRAKIQATGHLKLQLEGSSKVLHEARFTKDSDPRSLAAQLAEQLTAFLGQLTRYNQTSAVQEAKIHYQLKQIASPRYWQPKEPSILVTAQSAASNRGKSPAKSEDADQLLDCPVIQGSSGSTPKTAEALSAWYKEVTTFLQKLADPSFGLHNWSQQPWQPFWLEWEVEVFPLKNQSNLNPERAAYGEDFINDNYILQRDRVDLKLKPGAGETLKGANIYRGMSDLNPANAKVFQKRVQRYLQQQLSDDSNLAARDQKRLEQDIPSDRDVEKLKEQYEESNSDRLKTAGQQAQDPVYTALRAQAKLSDPNVIFQSLGGFNDALLMRKETLQLNIADPVAFPAYRGLTQEVRDLLAECEKVAPVPGNDFNPIRSGELRIRRLRLVDIFGQIQDVPIKSITTSQAMSEDQRRTSVLFPPRVIQPLRLNFRWLSANSPAQELSPDPSDSPVCGWLLPNLLDRSLTIYGPDGGALGSMVNRPENPWRSAPGREQAIAPQDIANASLKKLVAYLLAWQHEQPPQNKQPSFLDQFLWLLERSLEQIDPAAAQQDQCLSLLVGRPLAVVRSSLSWQLQGRPVINQGWHTFVQDLKRSTRSDDAFSRVNMPIRLGNPNHAQDGLIGYWVERAQGYEQDCFYAVGYDAGSRPLKNSYIKSYVEEEEIQVMQALADPPQLLTMLMDPWGQVQATSGLVPVKTIDLPQEQLQSALEAMDVNILTAPLLTDQEEVRVSLPTAPGYRWSWVQNQQGVWSEQFELKPFQPQARFAEEIQIREGWVQLSRQEDGGNFD